MALPQEKIEEVKKAAADFLKRKRPPKELRHKVDLAYRIDGQTVHIFEIRPNLLDPKVRTEPPVAKAKYVKSKDVWEVYWMRGNLKWQAYQPTPFVENIREFFDLVERDPMCCFFG